MNTNTKAMEIVKKAIKTVNKASDIIQECHELGFATVSPGVFLETCESLLEQAETWHDDDPGKAIDYNAYPYWLTTDCGTLPIGITGADDPDLLNAIGDNPDLLNILLY
jgi:hypothetical protein